eukprot:CAMPEP_0113685108 /NCGR_PEP_ID=MMETSP0038_2-20120614/14449_1 /TAXON_ID=2898 /ORGANISM="Cryptomonas paramecium" /LENGTH=142 /DNA_ID=CAMNT_0000605079 /DNA_START=341 /DNA_END=765 /DNA_ORIENTATION=- /assembly_acc=CAM_ASM_000170
MAGDLFCMLHTFDGVSRSRTVASAIVYSSSNPTWPSNGNGNAFVLPVRRTDNRRTILVVTIWDGSESVEEANPVGKVEINLEPYMLQIPPLTTSPDENLPPLPARADFRVTLVPRLRELDQGQPILSLMLDRSDAVGTDDSS